MTTRLTLAANGVYLDLTNALETRAIQIGALGLPPMSNIMEQGPLQHGSTFVDMRLAPRLIPISLSIFGSTIGSSFDRRQELLNFFQPGVPMALAISYDWTDANTYVLECFVNGGLMMDTQNYTGWALNDVVELIAPDPTWSGPYQLVEQFNIGESAGMAIPTAVATSFTGAGTTTTSKSVNYTGTWDSFPLIRIYGAITDPIITNNDTGEILDFTGTTIAAGDCYVIDCRYGYKTITDASAVNQIADLTAASDLATWHLARRRAGETIRTNSITVSGSAIDGGAKVYITYYPRYLGV